MRPILFEIAGVAFPAWHAMFFLATSSAYFFFLRSLSFVKVTAFFEARKKIESNAPLLFLICYISGWLGARALSIVVEQFDVNSFVNFVRQLFTLGPMTFYGGAIAAFVFGGLWVWWRDLRFGLVCDAAIPAAVLGLGIGRIGCFLNGDDVGKPVADQLSPPFFSVRFDEGGVYRYPIQLEEGVFSIVLAFIMFRYFKRNYEQVLVQPGKLASITVLISSLHRFANEYFRGDARGLFWGTQLSTSQGIALILTTICVTSFVYIDHLHRSHS